MSWGFAIVSKDKEALKRQLDQQKVVYPEELKSLLKHQVDAQIIHEENSLLVESNGHLDPTWGGEATIKIRHVKIV